MRCSYKNCPFVFFSEKLSGAKLLTHVEREDLPLTVVFFEDDDGTLWNKEIKDCPCRVEWVDRVDCSLLPERGEDD